MPGLAAQLYQETFSYISSPSHALFDDLIRKKVIQRIDYQAAVFLSQSENASENLLLLLAFLFSSARRGHLCIELQGGLKPALYEVWKSEGHLEEIEERILLGFETTPLNFFENHSLIKRRQGRLYLERNAFYEKEITTLFKALESTEPLLQVELSPESLSATPSQFQAIEKSFRASLSFITGGPGVGKTYTAAVLIQEFLKKYPESKVAIASPTGKAVANLKEAINRFFLEKSPPIDSMTLHKLFYRKILSYLPYDLLIVDESSMIDAHFMLSLLKYCKPRSRLILIGDENQLPPVGSGFVFKDLLGVARHTSQLSECLRTEIKEILQSAEAVKLGQSEQLLSLLKQQGLLLNLEDKGQVLEKLLQQIPKVDALSSDYERLVTSQTYKILSPVRQGEFGIIEINEKIRKLRSHFSYHPIIITSNDYKLELFNGDVGLLNDQNEALFFSRSGQELFYDTKEKVRRVPKELLFAYELAYCLSIHKSQGSEYDKVSILIPETTEVFARELLYTAITRAKKKFEIFSNNHTLSELVKRQHKRVSGLGSLYE